MTFMAPQLTVLCDSFPPFYLKYAEQIMRMTSLVHEWCRPTALLPKVDSTNDNDTQGGILESNQADPAKAGNATGLNKTEKKPNKNKAKQKDTDLMAKS